MKRNRRPEAYVLDREALGGDDPGGVGSDAAEEGISAARVG